MFLLLFRGVKMRIGKRIIKLNFSDIKISPLHDKLIIIRKKKNIK